jgi:hypothetical protein
LQIIAIHPNLESATRPTRKGWVITSAIIGKSVTSADGNTSGIVVSVELSAGGGAIATLKDGSTVTLGPGVIVAAS